jgi:hypothetical protein
MDNIRERYRAFERPVNGRSGQPRQPRYARTQIVGSASVPHRLVGRAARKPLSLELMIPPQTISTADVCLVPPLAGARSLSAPGMLTAEMRVPQSDIGVCGTDKAININNAQPIFGRNYPHQYCKYSQNPETPQAPLSRVRKRIPQCLSSLQRWKRGRGGETLRRFGVNPKSETPS